MELYREPSPRSRVSAISAVHDSELDRIARTIRSSLRVRGPADLEALLGRLLGAADGSTASEPRTLDLIGHSTSSTSLLQLGDWVIDADSSGVTAFFRGLARHGVLPRLGIRAVRLLACHTASTARGCATLCALADILGLEVLGTNHLLYDLHYDEHGFRDIWAFMLVSSSDLRHQARESTAPPEAPRGPRLLDIEALPALRPGRSPTEWPRRVATRRAMREILPLIRRDAGAQMPGLIAVPTCELALPSTMRGAYRVMQVLFDGAFVRCFPDGESLPGLVYPVDDAPQLRRIVGELAALDVTRRARTAAR